MPGNRVGPWIGRCPWREDERPTPSGVAVIVNRSAPPGPVVPTLVYDDVERAIAWLCDVFGFAENVRWGPPEHSSAELLCGNGAVFVTSPRVGHGSADRLQFRAPRAQELSHTVMVHIEGVDTHHEHAARRGARILLPPTTYQFGERQYSAQDIGGHVWTFTESVADVPVEDWGRPARRQERP